VPSLSLNFQGLGVAKAATVAASGVGLRGRGGGGHDKGVKELEGNGVATVVNEDSNSSLENVLKEKLQQQQVLVEQLQHRYSNNKNSRKSDFAWYNIYTILYYTVLVQYIYYTILY
jgi:hypothetical protein